MVTSKLPQERPEATRDRSWIIYSFWVVIVILGLPTWWQTTSIPRAALPLDDMLRWSDAIETRPIYRVPIRVAAPEIPCQTALKIIADTESTLNRETSSWGFETAVQLVRFAGSAVGGPPNCPVEEVSSGTNQATLDIELKPGSASSFDIASSTSPTIAIYSSKDADTIAKDLAEGLRQALMYERAAVSYQYLNYGKTDPNLLEYANSMPGEIRQAVEESATRAFKPSPDYHLTFSLFTPGGFPSSWNIEATLDQYIQPLLHALSSSTQFSVTTQIQLYSSFSPSIQPYREENVEGWLLRRNDLTAFVNTAEWPLSPSIGSGPTINFVLYVPSQQQAPLRVEGNQNAGILGGSWMVPQWGGITILNAPIVRNDPEVNRQDVIAHLSSDLLKPAFDVFQQQLLSLLGVPNTSPMSLSLRLKAFQRISALSLHLRTRSNLGSLARLAQHLNSIPIPRHVLDLVNLATDSVKIYREEKNEKGRTAAASEGYKASEKAFFDKAMVGQVYFPDEHKVAVYLPLLGPIGVPLVVGLLRELKALMARLKS